MDGDSHARNGNDLVAALVERGVNPDLAVTLLTDLLAPIVERTLAWYDHERETRAIGPGVLVAELRAGGATGVTRRPTADESRDYGDRVRAWLAENMPDVCGHSPERIEACARAYGEDFAAGLARYRGPHNAAVMAVMHLHLRTGRVALSVAEHGPRIRAAVKRAEAKAIADYQLIAPSEAAQPFTPEPMPPSAARDQTEGISGSAAPPGRGGD